MVLGERIKRIRTFRGLTQRELGLKLGYEERNADVRIAQYESSYRVPKKDTLMEIAKILNINYINFVTEAPGCAEDIMQTFFGLTRTTTTPFICFSLSVIPACATLLMISLFAIMIVTSGQLRPLSVCGLIMVLSMNFCVNGVYGKNS